MAVYHAILAEENLMVDCGAAERYLQTMLFCPGGSDSVISLEPPLPTSAILGEASKNRR
eukprot:CAMPEP_0194058536 /NCGR_PEP_ID=MMETSP0009_2-20130614/66532_1 /TAXON_ID=210454 /ORGANISM="Grammatophora oceanica, Strain CCMP 410" /LENGTH=58 /DNA_ID=CAMNT_0038708725 /DNA_START=470 /DNA_END=646 /DNA_ORIENTATION=+